MPDEIYEVVAQGARYWFLLLMGLIVWRSLRWLMKDRRQRRKRLKLLPDAGYVGEFVVLEGGELPPGTALPVSWEGTLGSVRGCDVCVPARGVAKKHLWYDYDLNSGLRVELCARQEACVDGQPLGSRERHAYLAHGARLTVGEATLRLRMFAGFERVGAMRERMPEPEPELSRAAAMDQADAPMAAAFTPEQWQALQQMQQAQWLAWQAQQGAPDAANAANEAPENADYTPDEAEAPDGASDVPESASVGASPAFAPPAEGVYAAYADSPAAPIADDTAYRRPINPFAAPDDLKDARLADEAAADRFYERNAHAEAEEAPPLAPDTVFYPPVTDDDAEDDPYGDKRAYVGDDEAERAKRLLWDKYLKGGGER